MGTNADGDYIVDPEDYKPGSFGCHELLDRTECIGDMIGRNIIEHPSCQMNPEWLKLAEEASDALGKLYQLVGEAHL